MKTIYILSLALITLSITSCTKTIDVKLNDADSKVIIEANLIEGTNNFIAKVSRTSNYFESGTPPSINNAVVTLNDGTTTLTLNNLGNGNYSLPAYVATENTTYTLTVVDGSDTYTAVSVMPKKIILDSVTSEFQTESTFSDEGYLLFLNFSDPANIKNYYRATLIVNGTEMLGLEDITLFTDKFTDGNTIERPLFGEVYELGDTYTASLYSMNESNHLFFSTLSSIAGGSGGGGANAAPANPENNWSNKALGNFTTVCISSVSGVVQ